MTCIVGVIDKKNVYIGGDSAAVHEEELTYNIREDEKVFKKGDFIFGFSASFRMGQILRFKLKIPKQPVKMGDFEFMVTLFVDAVRSAFEESDFTEFKEQDCAFLVGYKGRLYEIQSDYQIGIPKEGYASVGCGSQIASGALCATTGKPGMERVKIALSAASKHSMGVKPPFKIIKL